MQKPGPRPRKNHVPLVLSLSVLAFAGGAVFAVKDQLMGGRGSSSGEITGSVAAAAGQIGSETKFPIPRFVTLKAEEVNVRRGPSNDHEVAFVFQLKGLPVEITAEFENWRKIRDSEGVEGWILQSMLTGKRNAYVAPWNKGGQIPLYTDKNSAGNKSAMLEVGVLASIADCDGVWCELEAGGHTGYAAQDALWGVYPGEVVD